MHRDFLKECWKVLFRSNAVGSDWQVGWGLLGGIAAMCCMGATDDRNKKSLFQVKLILSNIFFSGWNSRSRNFFGGGPTDP